MGGRKPFSVEGELGEEAYVLFPRPGLPYSLAAFALSAIDPHVQVLENQDTSLCLISSIGSHHAGVIQTFSAHSFKSSARRSISAGSHEANGG